LIDFLCRDRVLHKKDSECLYEVVQPKKKGETGDDDDEKPKKKAKKAEKEEQKEEL
jgi:hypothetical protein